MNNKIKFCLVSISLMVLSNCVWAQETINASNISTQTAFDFKNTITPNPTWNWNGWQTVELKNGYFQGKANGKTNNTITSPELNINADKFRYLELYVSNEGVVLQTSLYFFTDNTTISSDKHIFTEIENPRLSFPQKLIIDLGACPNWKGTVKKIMLSFPPRSVGSLFIIYGLQFVEKPNYLYNGNLLLNGDNTLPMDWTIRQSDNVAITHISPDKTKSGQAELALTASSDNAGKAVVSTELKHMHNEHYYRLTLNYLLEGGASCVGKVVLLNPDGSVLQDIPAAIEKETQNVTSRFQVPKLAYIGKVIFDANLPAGSQLIIKNAQLDYLESGIGNWSSSWIWLPQTLEQQSAYFFKKIIVDKSNLKNAILQATCDDRFRLFLNGEQILQGEHWAKVEVFDILSQLEDGENILTVHGFNTQSYNAGLLAEIRLTDSKNNLQLITTDDSWKVTENKPADWPSTKSEQWQNAKVIGQPPCNPWSTIKYYTEVPSPKPARNVAAFKDIAKKHTKYSVDTSLGYPRICSDGKILTPLIFGGPCEYPSANFAAYENAVRSGFHIYRIWLEFGRAWHQNSYNVDLSQFDSQIEELVTADPNARFFFLFRISAPSWWLEKYPDDVCRFSDNMINGAYGILPSTSSKRWRNDVTQYLNTLIKHTESAWYSDRIIAYMPSSHCGPEWVLTTKTNQYPDYSPAMISFFRNWLKEKYKDVEQLQKAWKNETITFDTAQVPPRELRDGEQYFIDPAISQQVIDYNRCLNESVSTAILEFQEHINKLCSNRCLNFAYYGYNFELAQLAIYPQVTGHYDLTRVMNSQYINGLASPTSYTYRQGGSVSGAVTAVSSLAIHNQLWIQEADIRTNLTIDSFGHKTAFNMEDAVAQNIREFAYAITRRFGIWYFDMSGGWFDNPLFEKDFRTMHKAYDWAIQRPISWHSPIAVFFDEKVLDRTSLLREHWGADNIKEMLGSFRYGLGRCGIPYDSYVIDDIYKINPKQYKCIVLLNAWQKDKKLKQYLDENFCRDGHMIIWMYAPGYSGDILSTDNMNYMTGLKFGSMPNVNLGYNLNRKHTFFTGPEFTGIDGGDEKLSPPISFYVVDPNVEVLGTSIENGKPIFVMCQKKDYSTTFMASPDHSGLVWRKLFEQVGIKSFVDKTDCVYYDGDFFGIHFIDGSGRRKIMLENDVSAVWDVFSGQKICEGKHEFTIEAKHGQSRMFFLGNDDKMPFGANIK
ncbi:MAG: hypothetical protein A2Y10_01250 [Planctomycetes bacterium GWF2_41_51]|nr:MAG: hypothetical protein A2Y10_01250 [Planctomycetes bacterium GWF2_41_51]HBG25629.1 hypothetical protein [Phycisphaerales bacterium]